MQTETKSSSEFYENPIAIKDLVRGKPNVRALDERTEVVVFVQGSEFKIFRNQCPHMGAPMVQGKICGPESTVQCPWHGYIFDCATGELKENPNERMFGWMKNLYKTYQPELTPKYKLQVFVSDVRDGHIYVHRSLKS